MKVSIIIVSYQAKYYLEHCLNSLFQLDYDDGFEVIVVDNASPDDTVAYLQPKFKQVRWIESKQNLGFAKANNHAAKQANGDYLLILNPDTFVPENLLSSIVPFAQSKTKLGALGVRLIDGNGMFHPESKRNIPTANNTFSKLFGFLFGQSASNYYNNQLNQHQIGTTPILVGAFMLMKKEVYQKLGGFDEDYFMYGEDIDLSYQLHKKGYQNYYYGKATVVHYKGKSSAIYSPSYLNHFFGAMQIFLNKHYKNKLFSYVILSFGVWARYLLTKFLLLFNHPLQQEKVEQTVVLDQKKHTNLELIQLISNRYDKGKEFLINAHSYCVGNNSAKQSHNSLTEKEIIIQQKP